VLGGIQKKQKDSAKNDKTATCLRLFEKNNN
jgi:hypothetical protein